MIANERGLTLAEILAAMVIIGIGIVGLSVVVPISSYGLQEGNQLSKATFLADQKLEQIRNAPWTATPANDCLGLSPGSPNPTSAPSTGGTACTLNGAVVIAANTVTFADENPVAAPYSDYSRTVRVTDCSVAPGCAGVTNAGMRLVSVSVSYTPLTGVGVASGTKAVTLQMLVSQR